MPALFPRWTNSAAQLSLLGMLTIGGSVPVGLMFWVRTPAATGQHAAIPQPVPFNHSVHVNGLHIDCRYCHFTVERAASAGLPPTAACVNCHRPALLGSSVFAAVRTSLATHRPIAWRRVDALPDFDFFNHSIHVSKGIGCETCHGRVDLMAQVAQQAPLSMGWCLGCHRDPEPHLRPVSEITAMGWDATHTSAADAADRAQLMRAYHVQQLTSCTTCHR